MASALSMLSCVSGIVAFHEKQLAWFSMRIIYAPNFTGPSMLAGIATPTNLPGGAVRSVVRRVMRSVGG